MLEIARLRAAVVECQATGPALDALKPPASVVCCRVAKEELWWIAEPERAEALAAAATRELAASAGEALVVDQSDGWALFLLPGAAGRDLLRDLALFPVPAPDARAQWAFAQGAVAGGPAKVLAFADRTYLFVPYPLRDHLSRRLREVGSVAGVRVVPGEGSFVPPEKV